MYKKEEYKEISDCFKEDLALVENTMKSLFSTDNKLSEEICTFLFAKSKRLRPLVLFLIKDTLNVETTENIVNLAAALEMLHSATLVHDDIIDEANLRRGGETFYTKFGSKFATLAGDYLLSLSLKLLCKINSTAVFKYFSENTLEVCKGEMEQFFSKGKILSVEDYIKKSQNKTGALFEAGVKSLLHIINKEIKPVSENTKKALIGFVSNFALGFQIYDDIENFLDTNREKTGSDFENGVYTLPWLYLFQQNYSYDMIDNKKFDEAFKYSKEYLNNVLNRADKCLSLADTTIKTEKPKKLLYIFKL